MTKLLIPQKTKAIFFLIFCCILNANSQSVTLISDQPDSNYYQSFVSNENLYFLEYWSQFEYSKIHLFDGEDFSLLPIYPNVQGATFISLGKLNNDFLFSSKSSDNKYNKIYIYDGVDVQILELNDSLNVLRILATFNDKLYFIGKKSFETSILYTYDGNELVAEEMPGIVNGSNFHYSEVQNQLFFLYGLTNNDLALWTFDGTDFTQIQDPTGRKPKSINFDFQNTTMITYTEDVTNPNEDFLYKLDDTNLELVTTPANNSFNSIIGYNLSNLYINYKVKNSLEINLYKYNNDALIPIETQPEIKAYAYYGEWNGKEYFTVHNENTYLSHINSYDGNTLTPIAGPDNYFAPVNAGKLDDRLLYSFVDENSNRQLAEYKPGDTEFSLVANSPSNYTLYGQLGRIENKIFYRYISDTDPEVTKLYAYDINGLTEIETPAFVDILQKEFTIHDKTYFAGVNYNSYSVKLYSLGSNLSIEEVLMNENQVTIYPNPLDYQMNIVFNDISNLEYVFISINGIDGKLIDTISLERNDVKEKTIYNTENLSNGTYFINFQTNLYTKTIKVIR